MILFAQAPATLGYVDFLTLAGYFIILGGIAWWVISQRNKDSKDYFLAGKRVGWVAVGCSLFAANIGSEHLVGLAGTGASDGMAMAHYELHAWCLLVLGWLLVPFYERSGIRTMPEFLEKRYCPHARWFLSVVCVIAYILTKISVALFAGGIVFKVIFPIDLIPGFSNFWLGAIGMVIITGLYTILGGLRAVIYTDLMQTAVLLIGTACVLFVGLHQVGGWQKLRETVQDTDRMTALAMHVPNEAGELEPLRDNAGSLVLVIRPRLLDDNNRPINKPFETRLTADDIVDMNLVERLGMSADEIIAKTERPEQNIDESFPQEQREQADHMNLWKPNSHPQFPWFGLLIGAPIVGLWYWCTDQYIVQRTLAAANQREARRGTIFGAYLKLTPVFLFIVPGMIAYALAVQGKIGPEVLYDPNQAFPILVKEVLPIGLKGIVVAALMAALMSSLASVFNASSALFTLDIYSKIVPNSSELHLVWVGRIATGVMVIFGLVWIPIITMMPGTLYGYLQSVQAYIAPPIFAVFFLGVFYRRVNAYGCMAGLVGGFILGMCRLFVEIIHNTPGYAFADGTFLHWFASTSFTFVCIYLTLICCALIIGISYLTPKPRPEQLLGTTYGGATEEQKKETRDSWTAIDVITTVGLITIIICIYIYFTG